MKVKIEIDTKTFVRFWLVVLGFVLAGLMVYSARTALIIIGIAFFLAMALNTPVGKLAKLLPGKSRVGGTAIAFLTVVTIITGFGITVVPPIIEQSARLAQTIPGVVEDISQQWSGLNDFIDNNGLRPQMDSAINSISEQASGWAANAGSTIISSVGSFAAFLTAGLLVLVLSFLMLVEGPVWIQRLWKLYSDKEKMENHKQLVDKMYNVVTGYVVGQLIVSSIGALAAGLVVFILSMVFPEIPSNLSMPTIAITFLLSLIPMFGATIGGALVTLLLAFNNLTAAVVYVIYFVIYQQIENNVISPHVQGKSLELSALTVLASVTIGIYMFGPAGGIIAIPIAGCCKVLLQDYLKRAKTKRQQGSQSVSKLVKKITANNKA